MYVCVRMCVCMCVCKTVILKEEIMNLRGGGGGTWEDLERDKAVGKIECTYA